MGLTCACFLSVGSCTSHTIGGLSDVDFVRYIWHSLHYIYSTFIPMRGIPISSDFACSCKRGINVSCRNKLKLCFFNGQVVNVHFCDIKV